MNKIVNRPHKWCCYCSLYIVGTNQKYEVTVTAEWAIIFGINVTSSRLPIAGAYPGVTGVSPPSWMRFCYLNKPRLERGSVRENWSVLLEINGQWAEQCSNSDRLPGVWRVSSYCHVDPDEDVFESARGSRSINERLRLCALFLEDKVNADFFSKKEKVSLWKGRHRKPRELLCHS